jgi:hypothetical protein
MVQYVIPALLGLVAGVVGSLVAPWVNWSIEKRRSLMNSRREYIKTWRNDVAEFAWETADFRLTATYSAMKPHLRAEVIDSLQTGRPLDTEDRGIVWHKEMVLDEIARIEKEWGLV